MRRKGKVLIDRKIMDWRWYKKPKVCHLFLHLIFRANWEEAPFESIRETGCTAVLDETVFIDTPADLAKVKTASGQRKCGEAIAKAVAEVRSAKRKVPEQAAKAKLYKVQVGAYSKRENAEAMLQRVKAAGFADAYIKAE